MKKLLHFFDTNLLRFGVAFAILFTALYPKLPSININHTWVYIRLEDFLILALAVIWFIQLLRKKVSLPRPEGYALILYWVAGLVSLLYCLAFIAPQLLNFFPTVAGLQYARRIEYMILFFIAFSTIKHAKDVYFYLTTLCITVVGIVVYGFGQKFYLDLWKTFPEFFEKYPFCFPAFLTGNEEFAKGLPLCLTETSRVTSTFGGHYDLSAYLVMVIPILIALFFAVKRVSLKIGLFVLTVLALEVLNFTSSRTSFAAYLVGSASVFVFWNRKRWIIPVLIVSIGVMFLLSDATIQRFAKTIQPVQVVSTETELSSELKEIIAKTKEAEENKKPEIPPASDFTVGKMEQSASQSSGFTTVLTEEQLRRLNLDEVAISTISGSFLIQKAYALDISFTTRFQAEWPRNWNAFLYSPVFGTGYSSLTLATDNDYLRALGETGLAGLLSFLFIFVVLGIFMKNVVASVKDDILRAFLFGLAGGVVGLLVNAVLIDVFEASKVAEPLWILLGIGVGTGYLYKNHAINYKSELAKFLTSKYLIALYLLVIILTTYIGSISNFFVADDFTWLRWAASAELKDIPGYFINAKDFFYRPIDKTIVYFLYQLFSFQPEGYHIFILLIHYLTVIGVYFLATRILGKKLLGFLTAVIFALHPVHHENIYWFSTISVTLSSLFIVYTALFYLYFRQTKFVLWYIIAVVLSALAFLSYEMAVVIPLLLVVIDIFIVRPKRTKRMALVYVPFVLMVPLYFVIRYVAQAFSGGGDYSYSLSDLPFNALGNYFGYMWLFFGGNSVFPLYSLLRASLREQVVLAAIIMLLLAVVAVIVIFTTRKKLLKLAHNQYIVSLCFGLVFAAVSLLPFLGLGNIAPRYFYLASFGFSLAFVSLMHDLGTQLPHSSRKYAQLFLIAVVVFLSYFYHNENQFYAKRWQKAGIITRDTLKYFRIDFESFSSNTNVYFAGAPMRYQDVWLYPVGLNDALWFIYRDRQPQVYTVGSIDEAKARIQERKTKENYIFRFEGNRVIREQ